MGAPLSGRLSFTRAAQELCLTQSAVSREIKTLEEQLGQPLFSRINRGLRLTDGGQVLHRAVGQALALIDEATDRLAAASGGETLTVTTSVPLASMWLVPKLRRFVRLHPGVDVRSVAADQRLDLERERLDVAIRWAPSGSSVAGGEPPHRAILGCTHFPLVEHLFRRHLPPATRILSQPEIVADSFEDYLARHSHFRGAPASESGTVLLTTGDPDEASARARIFAGEGLRFRHLDV